MPVYTVNQDFLDTLNGSRLYNSTDEKRENIITIHVIQGSSIASFSQNESPEDSCVDEKGRTKSNIK